MIQSSFEKAKSWVKELQRQANPNIVIALVGNKVDLLGESSGSNADENDEDDDTATATPEAGDSSSLRAVPKDEAEAYAKEAGLLFFETSAKTGEGVVEVFTEIGEYNAPRESCCSPTIPGDAMVEPLSDPKLALIGPNYSQEDPNRPSPRTQCCCGSYRRCCGKSGRRWPGRRCGPERQQPAATRCLQLLILARSLGFPPSYRWTPPMRPACPLPVFPCSRCMDTCIYCGWLGFCPQLAASSPILTLYISRAVRFATNDSFRFDLDPIRADLQVIYSDCERERVEGDATVQHSTVQSGPLQSDTVQRCDFTL